MKFGGMSLQDAVSLLVGDNRVQRISSLLQWAGLVVLLVNWRYGLATSSDTGWWLYLLGTVALIAGVLLIFIGEGAGPVLVCAGLAGFAASVAFLILITLPVDLVRYMRRLFGHGKR